MLPSTVMAAFDRLTVLLRLLTCGAGASLVLKVLHLLPLLLPVMFLT